MSTKINPIARSLRSPHLQPKAVRPKKGKRSYQRRRRNGDHNPGP